MKYAIGDKTYFQKPLVLGQIMQLLDLLKDVSIPKNASILTIINSLGDRLPNALAIVLIPEGISLKDKDIDQLAKEIKFSISPEITITAVEDFFDCNPIASLLERFSGLMVNLKKKIILTGLKISASSSPEETSQKETISSGDIALENASLISSSESEK